MIAKLDGVAKKHDFASFDEYNTVIGNISIVMDGIDPQTKKYIGSDAGLKQQVEEVKTNKQMSAARQEEGACRSRFCAQVQGPGGSEQGQH